MLAGWSSWGAVPLVFDETRDEYQAERAQLREVLTPQEYTASRRTTINAHYTDPAYVAAMWESLADLGFAGGNVLEPGCGSGTFIGLAPEQARMTGVELDPITAGIAGALYPQATVRAESFADTRYPAGHFDAVIGNVPFGDVVLHDKRHNPGKLSIHNHFIVKSLALTRPGGMVAVLTSSFTMDSTNPAARREMYAMADLVGAVRLPTGAHRRTSGTEVVTDMLILRRREPGAAPGPDGWVRTQPRRVDDHVVRINGYYAANPEKILGTLSVGTGMYGNETVHVSADLTQTAGQVRAALEAVVGAARERGDTFTGRQAEESSSQPVAYAPDTEHWTGHITAREDGTFTVLTGRGTEPLPVPQTQTRELTRLLALRDATVALFALEAADIEDTPELTELRTTLATTYAGYVREFGPINRFTTLVSKTKIDEDTGEPKVTRRAPAVMRFLRVDPFGPLVKALEVFDESTQTAKPATLLTERVIAPRPPVLGADNAGDALALTLNEVGRADLTRIAELLGVTPDEARTELGTLVFDDPAGEGIIPATEYLSGNVRTKLDQARDAVASHPHLAVNVTALEKVLPVDLGADEITPAIGAVWISDDIHRQFLSEILNDPTVKVFNPGGTIWAVTANAYSLAATNEWGTERLPAHKILHRILEQRPITVTDDIDGKRVVNDTDTAAAREKASLMQDRFADWVWEDPARTAQLTQEYNRRFNSLVLRDYSDEGTHLTLPGLAKNFTPRPHQLAAVARMISEPAVGLFHEVGAGKTAEMVIGAMELRRLGMVNKPVVVIPNHMLEQFSREWLQLYPQARILAASSEDLAGDKRREFVARTATNDWDAVIMTRTAFQRIEVSSQSQSAYLQERTANHRAVLERAKTVTADSSFTVKRIEKAILQQEEKQKRLLDHPTDPGLTFESAGIDYLIVDEGHDYKNLATVSNIPDAAIMGSQRASDLHMKTEVLRKIHGNRVITMATATPLANSVTEAHVVQRYLRPDLLAEAGVLDFDNWANTFGKVVSELEMSPTGSGYRTKSRFARFQNVPEMLRMWHAFADVKTAEDLQLPVPDLAMRADGKRWPETVVIPPSESLLDYIAHLGERVDRMSGRAEKGADNMLLVTTDGRKAALDLRLVGRHRPPDQDQKVQVVAKRVLDIYRATAGNEYLDATGETAPEKGALQIVFCDQSTPNPDRWNFYTQLRRDLVDQGIPWEKIRFIHEARNDTEKAALFAAARSGHVAVLLGSTGKMGVGTNVQARAVALHHVDCPWRPADLQQRDGRILRQGNQNPEVQIVRYTVERSFDSYSWQTVERKAKFIAQILRGKIDVREMEDIGDAAMGMAETKAITSGDPLILEKANAETDVARLERLARAHQRNVSSVSYRARSADHTITAAERDEPALQAAIEKMTDTTGDRFAMTVGRNRYDNRVDAAEQLNLLLRSGLRRDLRSGQEDTYGVIAQVGGHQVMATQVAVPRAYPDIRFELVDVPRSTWHVTTELLSSSIGLVRQIENRVAGLPDTLAKVQDERTAAIREGEQARLAMGKPFRGADELAQARERLSAVVAEMEAKSKPPAQVDPDPATGAPALPPVTRTGQARPITRNPRMAPQPATQRTRMDRIDRTHHQPDTSPAPSQHEMHPQPDTGLTRG
ncbi:helicase [Nakamurella silvestris]|nr:helicase [Nakamurella silvestris]